MSALSAACPVYLIGPVQAGRPTWAPRRAAHQAAARFRVEIELVEFLPVAAIGKRGEREIGNARFLMLGLVGGCSGASGRRESRHAGEGVVPPGAVVVRACHGLPELSVVGNVNA